GSFRDLGAIAVRGPRMGQHGFEALAASYPSDALLRDARYHAGLFGHLRECCFAAQGVAARFRVRYRSPGIMVAYGDSCSDSRVNITQAVTSRPWYLTRRCSGRAWARG